MAVTVFYDGKCGLCSKEIRHYKKLDTRRNINWLDANQHTETLNSKGISLADALMYLHVLDAQGNWCIGVDGFIVIWKNLPQYRWLAGFVRLPIIRGLSGFMYKKFAKWRFRRLTHCQLSVSR